MSLKCNWTYDGKNFNSERDLDNYLINNFLSQVEALSDIVFERSSRNSKTIEVLDSAGKAARERLDVKRNAAIDAMRKKEINRTEDIENKTVDDTPIEVYSDDYQPVSEYVYNMGEIERLSVDNYVSSRLNALSRDLTVEDMDKISEVKRSNPDLTTNEEIFNKVIDNELLQWKYIRKTGKALDKLFGIVINQKHQYYNHFVDAEGKFNVDAFIEKYAEWKDSSGESWYDLQGLYDEELQPDGTLKKISPILQSFIDQVQRLKNRELNLKLTDKIFYQYTADYATTPDLSTGIRGKMDIVVVRSGGRVDIYDIKVSSKDARGLGRDSEWDSDKIKSTEYQLGFYGKMIENLGIDPSRISLNVIPIQLRNIKKNTAGDIRVNSPIRIVPRAEIQRFINATIPVELTNSPASEEVRNNIKNNLEGMFPTILINNQILNVNDDYFFETKKIRREGTKFVFSDYTGDAAKLVYADSKEEILEKYKEYLKTKIEDGNSWFNFLKGNLNRALDEFREGRYNTFDTLFGDKVPSNIQLNFRKYFSAEGWGFAEFSPEINAVLDGLNIMVLYNERTGVHDIISLSNLDLDREIKLKYGNNIFGNYKSNTQVGKNSRKSSIGNVLLMRNMAVANVLTQAIPNIDFIFGDISVFDSRRDGDTSFGKAWSLPSYKLIEDAKTLHGLSGSTFDLSNNNVVSVDEYIQDLFNQVMRASNSTEYDALPGARLSKGLSDKLGNTFKTFENLESEMDRMEMLEKLWVQLNNAKGKTETTIARLMESPDFDGYLYRETARLLSLSSNTFMDLYNFDPMEKWGIENFLKSIGQKSFLNGTMTMTIDTVPISETVHNAILKVNQRIRHDMERYKTNTNRKMFKLVGLDSNVSMFNVKRFYDDSEEGRLLFLFKNPETDSSLTPDEKTFLTWYLLELNNMKADKTLTEQEVNELKQSKEYYKVPLLRRSNFSRIVNGKGKNALNPVEGYNEVLNNFYNLRNAVIGLEEFFDKDSDYRDMIKMYNTFAGSEGARAKLLAESMDNHFDKFEAHPEVIMDMFAQSKFTTKQYDAVLPAITASIACLNALGFSSGIDVKESYDFINQFIKSSIFNESLLPKNQLIKAITAVKSKVSMAVLGFNPLSGGKEVLNGIYYHYTRAVANKIAGDKDKVGLVDMNKAYSTVWLDAAKQIGTITKLEKINTRFGMSNMDINALSENYNYYKTDPLRFKYLTFYFNRAPDFLNRMTVFTGYMYKYGNYDAYTVNNDTGILEYNWKKDGRFNLLASNDKTNMTAYLEQRALYSKTMQDLIEQGYEYTDPETGRKRALRWDPNNFESETNDVLPEGFTNKQIKAIKQESDRAFGYMDHDTKSMMFKSGITAVFFLFKTFATAKLSQWLLKPGTYDQGYYRNAVDPVTGQLIYRRIFLNPDGSWDSEFVTTLFIEENGQQIELEPVKEWVGSHMEGMLWSVIDLLSPLTLINALKRKEAWSNPLKRANLLIAMQEVFLLLLISWLIAAIYDDQQPRDIDNFLERNAIIILNNSTQDLDPFDTIFKGNLTLDFTAYDFMERFVPEVAGALFGMDNRSWYKAASRLGATSLFRKELYDAHRLHEQDK